MLKTWTGLRPLGIVLFAVSAAFATANAAERRDAPVTRATATGVLETVAGGFLGDGGPALSAALSSPWDVAVDAAGNAYIADRDDNRIRKVSTGGIITTFAGSGLTAFSGDGGPAVQAGLNQPMAVAFDAAGNLYVAEAGGNRVRRITPAGVIDTVAGTGAAASTGDGGPAVAAALNQPEGIALDAAGNVYVSEFSGHRVRKFAVGGTIQTIAGTGVASFSGDGGPGTAATLNRPSGIVVNPAGDVFIADMSNNRIRKLDAGGTMTTVAGSGGSGCGGSGSNALLVQLAIPTGVALSPSGELYLSSGCYVHRLRGDGGLDWITGNGNNFGYNGDGMLASGGVINTPSGLEFDLAGNLLFADTNDNRVRRVELPNPQGVILTSLAGKADATEGQPGFGSSLGNVSGVAVGDPSVGAFIADRGTQRIRLLKPDGTLVTFAGTGMIGDSGAAEGDGGPATQATVAGPWGIAVGRNGGPVFIAERQASRVRMVNNGVISIVVGACCSSAENVPAVTSAATGVVAIAVAPDGSVYIAQRSKIRRFIPGGNIATFAGTNTAGFNGDGLGPLATQFSTPYGIAFDQAGALYVADTSNNRIRKIAGGIVTTIAGTGTAGYSGDGGQATSAMLNAPRGVVVDDAGNVYVSDSGNARVRRIAVDGTITTIAGSGVRGFSGESGAAGLMDLDFPWGLALDGTGGLLIADHNNARVRRLQLPTGSPPDAPRMGGASAGAGEATVSFSPPVAEPSSPITGYIVTSIPGGGVDTQAGSPALTHLVTGLVHGTSYQFSVKAINANGNSVASGLSNAVVPMPRTLSVADASIAEGDAGTKVLNFTVSLSESSITDITFYANTAPGTASEGEDYVALAPTQFTIPTGQTSVVVPVTIIGDAVPEANETLVLEIGNAPTGAAITRSQAKGTLVNDDLASLALDDVVVAEGTGGTRTASVVVRLSAPLPTPVTFDIATGNGTAVAGSDYTARAQVARVLDAGRTSATFDVAISADAVDEADETFVVTLGNAVGATIGDGSATVTIQDDDGPALTAIPAIQGRGGSSPLAGKDVEVEGVVTAVLRDGFVLQSPTGEDDGDAATSEGLFVRAGANAVRRGDRVHAAGRVVEATSGDEAHRASVTSLSAVSVRVLAHDAGQPAVAALSPGDLFDDAALESREGMRIAVPRLRIVAPSDGDAGRRLRAGNGLAAVVPAGATRPIAGAIGMPAQPLLLDPAAQRGATPRAFDVGDQLAGAIGVLGEADGAYRLLPDADSALDARAGAAPRAARVPAEDEFALAVVHVDPSTGAGAPLQLAKAAHQLCAYAQRPAVVAVLTPGAAARAALADAAGAGTDAVLFPGECAAPRDYRAVGAGNALGLLVDGAEVAPGRARVGVLSVTALGANERRRLPSGRLEAVHQHAPMAFDLLVRNLVGGDVRMTVLLASPTRIDGDLAARGADGYATRGDALRARRTAELRSIARLAAARAGGNLLLAGDFDAGEVAGLGARPGRARADAERPAGNALRDLTSGLAPGSAYNAVRDGIAVLSDHVLASEGLASRATVDVARVNADFAEDNRGDTTVPLRVSDRDPLVVYLQLR